MPVVSPFTRPRSFFALALLLCIPTASAGQTYARPQPRRQFISISYDWLYTQPLHFAEHPLEDLLGTEVASAQRQEYDYETRDGSTRIEVLEFRRRTRGAGVTLYPLGLRAGPTLAIRGSFEDLPTIRLAFDGPGTLDSYVLAGARAYDAGIGLFVADRSAGWGLGSHAFVAGGAGRIRSDLGDGTRYFAEGGGGLSTGPFGVQLAVKFAWNRLNDPIDHRFFTVPVTIRAMVSF